MRPAKEEMSNYTYKKTSYPKKPVKSFQDLEVYQKVLAVSVTVNKRINEALNNAEKDNEEVESITRKTLRDLLTLPILIATAHSLRFVDQQGAVDKLEEVLLKCNLCVVRLELYRDLGTHRIETEFFDENIKILLLTRNKVLRLENAWKKFFKEGYNKLQ